MFPDKHPFRKENDMENNNMKKNNMENSNMENSNRDNNTMENIEHDLDSFRQLNQKLKRQYETISLVRLIVFAFVVIGVLLSLAAHIWWGWLIAIAGIIIFIVLMQKHEEIDNWKNYMERFIKVHERYQKRKQGNWHDFSENGGEYLEEQDYVSVDLDVLGTDSLYQMICTAHTDGGKRRLAEVLCVNGKENEMPSFHELMKRQEAVAELVEKSRFALNFEALAMQCEKEEQKTRPGKVEEELSQTVQALSVPVALRILAWVYPVLFIGSIIGSIVHWWDSGVILVLFFSALLVSFLMNGYCQKRMSRAFEQSGTMQTYLYMMDALATEEFHSAYLKELQRHVIGNEGKADGLLQGLRRLERLISLYNFRYNPIVHWLLSGVCLYDLHLASRVVQWEQKYGANMEAGIAALGEVEMLSSLAVLGRIREVSYPILEDSEVPKISMLQVYHPLLPIENAVANDISLQQQTVVITGSNMSGKTTFLRTIGLNLILAYAGAPVCGTQITVSHMKLFTSMRILDDVQHGISTFYAEILRIKEMVAYGKKKYPMLCLIDEIFKGTNSADRIVGAEAVIRCLTNPYTITMVSTHDFELCKLAENYHFEEYYEGNEIHFDYHLRKGKCTTTNALYLLKMAGLGINEFK